MKMKKPKISLCRRILNSDWAHQVALLLSDETRFQSLMDKYWCSDAEMCLRMSAHDEALAINAPLR